MVGKTISHYKITEKLGEGGMGEVYLADDTKLKRQVAIKFLPEHLTKDKENVERFEREAEAAAALNHPNIVTIFDVIETDGQICIIMEYVNGDSLRTKIDKGISDIGEILNITNQICEGLSEAHKADIVHRDIKPENILIDSRGRVKILDFGLAKLKGVSKLTKETSTLGTIHYMSPEQLQGKEVDQRSDIWSLGVVLYELLTGEVPFQGSYEQAVTYAILNEKPKRLKKIESKHSSVVSSIITKMIVKERENRYQNCSDLIDDLTRDIDAKPQRKKSVTKSIYSIAGIIAISILLIFSILYFYPREEEVVSLKSLAVLPFINERNDPETDYLGMSLADEIIGGLSYLQNIVIRPSSSIRIYKDKLVDPMSAGKELSVDYILSGSHLKEKDIIRLNIELAHVYADTILWRYKIEENSQNVFQLIDRVSKKVIDGLKIKFSPEERHRMEKDIPHNSLAYEYYLKSLSYPLTNEGSTLAIEMLKKSILLDSTFAPTFLEMGYHISRLAQHAFGTKGYYKEAERFYLKALQLNNDLYVANIKLAALFTESGRTDDAMEIASRVSAINPNNAWTHYLLSYICRYTGILDISRQEVEKMLEIDPYDRRLGSVIYTYLYLMDYYRALEVCSLYMMNAYSMMTKGELFIHLGETDSSLAYFESVLRLEPDGLAASLVIGMRAYIEKDVDKGVKVIKKWEQSEPYDSEILYWIARNYGLLGEGKGCIRVLKQAIDGGFYCYPFMLKDTFLDPVRDDPEFKEVLNLAKQKHEAFKKKYFPEEL